MASFLLTKGNMNVVVGASRVRVVPISAKRDRVAEDVKARHGDGPRHGIAQRAHATWTSIQVSHRGAYSIERLIAFVEFQRTSTSVWKVLALILLLPIPAFVVNVALDCIPLVSTELDWKAQWGFWIRNVGTVGFLTGGVWAQTFSMVPDLHITPTSVVLGSTATAVTYVTSVLLLSATLHVFPIPFTPVIAAPWFLSLLVGFMLVGVGRQSFKTIPGLKMQLWRLWKINVVMASLTTVYPTYNYVFITANHEVQIVLACLLPVIKMVFKWMISRVSAHYEDAMPEMCMFSVEIFHSLYLVRCMQTAGSGIAAAVIIALDAVQAVLSLHHLNQETKEIESLRRGSSVVVEGHNLAAEVVEICRHPDQLDMTLLSDVRLDACIPHKLSRDSQTILAELHRLRSEAILTDCRSSRSSGIQANDARFIRHTLKLMFYCECHALVEYIECIIPMLYALYLVILYELPNRIYYESFKGASVQSLRATVGNVFVYALLEVVSFVAMHHLMKRKFQISPMTQLAFVLQQHFTSIQGRMFVWLNYIFPFTLAHYGDTQLI